MSEIKVDSLLLHAQVPVERVLGRSVPESSAASSAADRRRRLRRQVIGRRRFVVLGPRVAQVVLASGLG